MDPTLLSLIKRAYATPPLRQNIFNKGIIYLYSDYSGNLDNDYGVACCMVYNRDIRVSAEKLLIEHSGGSNYGELLAILYSLDVLKRTLIEYEPKLAILYSDYHYISRLLFQDYAKPIYEKVRNDIWDSLYDLKIKFPEVEVRVTYISKHKKNNALHKIAHNAARNAIGK